MGVYWKIAKVILCLLLFPSWHESQQQQQVRAPRRSKRDPADVHFFHWKKKIAASTFRGLIFCSTQIDTRLFYLGPLLHMKHKAISLDNCLFATIISLLLQWQVDLKLVIRNDMISLLHTHSGVFKHGRQLKCYNLSVLKINPKKASNRTAK